MAVIQTERDYPIDHPAAIDYNGDPYSPPPPPLSRDYPPGHPKAADSEANFLEGQAQWKQRTQPGQPGIPNEVTDDAQEAKQQPQPEQPVIETAVKEDTHSA